MTELSREEALAAALGEYRREVDRHGPYRGYLAEAYELIRRLVRPETMRSSTSVSQVSGSRPFSRVVVRSEARMAQLRAPRSEPAKR